MRLLGGIGRALGLVRLGWRLQVLYAWVIPAAIVTAVGAAALPGTPPLHTVEPLHLDESGLSHQLFAHQTDRIIFSRGH